MRAPYAAPRPITEKDRWLDLEVALEDDCVEALQTKMEFHGIDVHMTYGFDIPWYSVKDDDQVTMAVNTSALSLAVTHGAVNCVAYLKEMGARSHDPLAGSGCDLHTGCIGYAALKKELDEIKEEEAKERWAKFALTRLGLKKWFAKSIFDECCVIGQPVPPRYTAVAALPNVTVNGQDISDFYEKLDSHDYCEAIYDMYFEAEFNTLQLATFSYGRDALITRLVRGEARKITKSYELGFVALWYYADSQRAEKDRRLSLLLAKKDGRLLLLLKWLSTIGMPVEIREKIVDFALFGKNAPELKAVKDESEDEGADDDE
jgi:hypothetical protein